MKFYFIACFALSPAFCWTNCLLASGEAHKVKVLRTWIGWIYSFQFSDSFHFFLFSRSTWARAIYSNSNESDMQMSSRFFSSSSSPRRLSLLIFKLMTFKWYMPSSRYKYCFVSCFSLFLITANCSRPISPVLVHSEVSQKKFSFVPSAGELFVGPRTNSQRPANRSIVGNFILRLWLSTSSKCRRKHKLLII